MFYYWVQVFKTPTWFNRLLACEHVLFVSQSTVYFLVRTINISEYIPIVKFMVILLKNMISYRVSCRSHEVQRQSWQQRYWRSSIQSKGKQLQQHWKASSNWSCCCLSRGSFFGWTSQVYKHITARMPGSEHLLINPFGHGCDEIGLLNLVRNISVLYSCVTKQ